MIISILLSCTGAGTEDSPHLNKFLKMCVSVEMVTFPVGRCLFRICSISIFVFLVSTLYQAEIKL